MKTYKGYIRGLSVIVALVMTVVFCSGCSYIRKIAETVLLSVSESENYAETVDEFFEAVDNRDKDAIRNMFSAYAQKKDKDLDEQIDRLLEVYSGPTDNWYNDELAIGDYSTDDGEKTASVYNFFPVISKGKYYWCSIDWMY